MLDHPRLLALGVGLSLLVSLPALWGGAAGDDWVHRSILLGLPGLEQQDPTLDLFRFLGPGFNEHLASTGLLPWWTDPDIRAAFFRPLSALTHRLDMLLWPDVDPLHHAHSLLWAAAMVGCAGAFLREVAGSPRVAALALLLFAVEDAHAMPVVWLANRNALITTTFSIVAVHAFVRWRRTGGWGLWLTSMAALVAGLLGGEAAIGAVIWMGVWCWTQETDRLRSGVALIGPAVVVVGWRVAYDAMGYGADLSGLYIDPGATPEVWLKAVVERWPLLVSGLLSSAPIDAWGALDSATRTLVMGASMVLLGGFGVLVAPVLRARRGARTAALAMVLVLLPVTATLPMDRLFAFASLASALLLAEMAHYTGLLDDRPSRTASVGPSVRRLLVVGLLVWHLPMAAMARAVRCASFPQMGRLFDVLADEGPRDAGLADQTLVVVQGNGFAAVYAAVKRQVRPELGPAPREVAVLSTGWTELLVERVDERTLRLTQAEGFLSRPIDHLFRDPARAPFVVGQRISHACCELVVEEVTEDGRPHTVEAHFDSPLEDGSRRFVRLTTWGTEAWSPPPVGERVRVEAFF